MCEEAVAGLWRDAGLTANLIDTDLIHTEPSIVRGEPIRALLALLAPISKSVSLVSVAISLLCWLVTCLVPGAWCLVASDFEKQIRVMKTRDWMTLTRHVHQVARSRRASAGGDTFCTCTLWRDNIPAKRSLSNSLPAQGPQSLQSMSQALLLEPPCPPFGKSRPPEITDFTMPSSMENWHDDFKKLPAHLECLPSEGRSQRYGIGGQQRGGQGEREGREEGRGGRERKRLVYCRATPTAPSARRLHRDARQQAQQTPSPESTGSDAPLCHSIRAFHSVKAPLNPAHLLDRAR